MKKSICILAILGLLITGCAAAYASNAKGPRQVNVTVKEFTVEMSTRTIPVNTPFKVIVTNRGAIEHEIVLEKADAVDEALEGVGDDGEIEHIAPGSTRSAVWTINEPGEYKLGCHTPGHYEAGMFQTFTVSAAAAGAPVGLVAMGGLLGWPMAGALAGLAIIVIVAAGLILRMRMKGARIL